MLGYAGDILKILGLGKDCAYKYENVCVCVCWVRVIEEKVID